MSGIVSHDNSLSKTIAIIPMLNECDSIGLVLDALPPLQKVIVVDNGSTDVSPDVARDHGALVIREPQRGYGAACLAGIAEAERLQEELFPDTEFILFLDADYSDHPEQADRLIGPLASGRAEMVIGSRARGIRETGAMPFQAMFGNRLACFLMRCFWNAEFTDLGPFLAIRTDALRRLNMQDQNFGWTIEMQIKAMQHGLRCVEVPVDYRRRIGASKISGTVIGTCKAGYKILYTNSQWLEQTHRRQTRDCSLACGRSDFCKSLGTSRSGCLAVRIHLRRKRLLWTIFGFAFLFRVT